MASLYRKPIWKTDPKSGERVRANSRKWWGRFKDHDRREKRIPLAADKGAAQAMLNELVRKVERGIAGLEDPFDTHRNRPLSEHVADFKTHLISKGNTAKHARITSYRITAVITGCKSTRIADVSASRVQEHLAGLRDSGTSVSSSNHYLRAIKMFTRWLVRDRRTADDVLMHLSMMNSDLDIRRERRTIEPSEIVKLIASTKAGKPFRGLSGNDRAILYLLALNTGLRANELASLSASSFHLDGESPTVVVEAGYSKHRRRDVLPIRCGLVATVRKFICARGNASPSGRLWPRSWYRVSAQMLQIDLAAAGIPYNDDRGRVFDFHSLRHQFISDLARAGVHPKEAQALARHSTITLTMDRYTHVGIFDLATALERLPALTDGAEQSLEVTALRATGTGGRQETLPVRGAHSGAEPTEKGAQIGAIRLASETQQLAPICIQGHSLPPSELPEIAEENAPVCTECVEISSKNERGAARIRTGASRICNPLP
jgi:site-specific recombinase XerD